MSNWKINVISYNLTNREFVIGIQYFGKDEEGKDILLSGKNIYLDLPAAVDFANLQKLVEEKLGEA